MRLRMAYWISKPSRMDTHARDNAPTHTHTHTHTRTHTHTHTRLCWVTRTLPFLLFLIQYVAFRVIFDGTIDISSEDTAILQKRVVSINK